MNQTDGSLCHFFMPNSYNLWLKIIQPTADISLLYTEFVYNVLLWLRLFSQEGDSRNLHANIIRFLKSFNKIYMSAQNALERQRRPLPLNTFWNSIYAMGDFLSFSNQLALSTLRSAGAFSRRGRLQPLFLN